MLLVDRSSHSVADIVDTVVVAAAVVELVAQLVDVVLLPIELHVLVLVVVVVVVEEAIEPHNNLSNKVG